MIIKIALGLIFAITAAVLTYISRQINGIYITNDHQVAFGQNPCAVAVEYVMMELVLLTSLAALLFLFFLYLYYKCNSSGGNIARLLSSAMLLGLLWLSVTAVEFHLTGIIVL